MAGNWLLRIEARPSRTTIDMVTSAPVAPSTSLTLSTQGPTDLVYWDNGAPHSVQLIGASVDVTMRAIVVGDMYHEFTITGANGSFGSALFDGVLVPGSTFSLASPGSGRIDYARGVFVAQMEVVATAAGYPALRFLVYGTGRVLTPTSVRVGSSGGSIQLPSPEPGVGYCFGDGSGISCPCGNGGTSGHGCANSVNPDGANLAATGLAVVASDTVLLSGTGMASNGTALYFQGTAQLNAVFGDGLRCVGGTVIRLGTTTNVGGASQYPASGDSSVSVRGGVSAGQTRNYQVWYRNAAAFCTVSTFNLTNGVSITWN